MLIKETKYSYNDIVIVPAIKTNVEHRNECNPYIGEYGASNLPIFTAPMSTVVNEKNFLLFEENNIIPILPRNINFDIRLDYLRRGKWVALGLKEFEDTFLDKDWNIEINSVPHVVIDIANGHMSKLLDMIAEVKEKYGYNNIIIMAGNIANPKTYYEYAKAGCDFVRCSIGSGQFCVTSSNVAVHYPIASLISEIYEIKKKLEQAGELTPYIIADGGIRNYSDVIKAYALGANYVMIGGEFTRLVESAAPTFFYGSDHESIHEIDPFEHKIDSYPGNTFDIDEEQIIDNLYKVGYGMASRRGQEDINGKKTKTSEGIQKTLPVSTNLRKWKENMVSYLQSAMSYTNCYYIDEFKPDNVDCIIISPQTKESINK